MATANRYEDISIVDALKLVKNQHLLLPDIQREYVWKTDDIEKLFESVVDGYPIGTCIFWKTNRKTINTQKPNLYFFIREFESGKTKNEKAPEVFSEEGDYYIVLDGQQRITSFHIALYGSYTEFKGGRGRARSNPKNWIKRELYYNLDFYNGEEVDDEHPKKRFVFLTEESAKEGRYYKVKQLLAFEKESALYKAFAEFDEKVVDDLGKLYTRLHSTSANGLIHYYCICENNYDEALDIFVRVNSTGVKLSKSDLLFSTLIDGWESVDGGKAGKEKMDGLLETLNSKGDGFSFSRDYIMRLMLVLVDASTNLKIESFDNKTVRTMRSSWSNMEKAAEKTVDLLVSLGISDGFLSSYNATMPLVYYIYRGGSFSSAESENEARKFLSLSMAKRLFGVASNMALQNTRAALQKIDCKHTVFSLKLFQDVVLAGGRNFSVREADIDYWLDNYTIGKNTYILLSLLYPNLKLSQVSFHQDHCHPYSAFENKKIAALNLPTETIERWQRMRNRIPNLQFLEGGENGKKHATPLKTWIESGETIRYLPQNVSLELKDFETFFEERKKLMKKELERLFDVNS